MARFEVGGACPGNESDGFLVMIESKKKKEMDFVCFGSGLLSRDYSLESKWSRLLWDFRRYMRFKDDLLVNW